MVRNTLLVASLGLALVGCGKKKGDSTKATGSGAAAAKPTAVEAPKAADGPAFIAQWDMAKRKAAWQGAWAGDGFSLGDTAAWEIKGDDVTFVHKKGEEKYKLSVDSPCTAGFSQKDGNGGSGGWESVYTLDKDGQLITGLGDAGSRKGDQAVVCGMGEVWVWDGKACTDWANHFGHWESKPGECGFKKDDKGADVFFYKDMSGYETKLVVDGDVIWSEQLSHAHATKHPDLAAAKAAQKL
jgi:hypothetical protein